MPELPDIVVYCEALESRILGTTLTRIRISSPFLVRSVDPPVDALHGQRVVSVSHIGKRIVLGCANHLFAVIHLMIAGRLRWRKPTAPIPKRNGVAAFDFEAGTVLFTEASKKRRASLHVVRGAEALAEFDRGGADVFAIDQTEG